MTTLVSSVHLHLHLLVLPLLLLISSSGIDATTFTLKNNCKITIWPGILSGAGSPALGNGGLRLHPGKSTKISVPSNWSGRIWPRTGCHFDKFKQGKCQTGDCGGRLHCTSVGGVPPVSLAEFTLDSPMEFYDVSLVDGYNVAVSVIPTGASPGGNCRAVRCVADLNKICPKPLRVVVGGKVVACRSACEKFGSPKYCCTGEFGTPEKCWPTMYSKVFKKACPKAYSYAYDDATSTYTCVNANYIIKFC